MEQIKKWLEFNIVFVFVFSLLFLGSIQIIGPLTVRNAVLLFVFVLALLSRRSENTRMISSKGVRGYYLWLIWYIAANILSGFLFKGTVFKEFITYHVVALILLYSIPRLLTTQTRIVYLFVAVFICYICNGLLSMWQFTNSPIAWAIGQMINPLSDSALEQLTYYGTQGDTLLSHAIVSGLTGFSVTNGYFIACFLPIVTYRVWGGRNSLVTWLGIIVMVAFSLYLVYCIQQRMALLVVCTYVLSILLFASQRRNKGIILCAIVFLVIFIAINLQIDLEKYGRLFSFEDEHRTHTGEYLRLFLSDVNMLLFGNNTSEGEINAEMVLTLGHNSFLNALRVAGVISFFIYIKLFFNLLSECYHSFINSINKNAMQTALSISCILYLLYSMTHSDGIPTGGIYFWLFYTSMHQSSLLFRPNE